jgi:hypothetical protein
MAHCPHLVIDAMGRCEWCFKSIVGNNPRTRDLKRIEVFRQEPDAKLLAARWAARFGEPEDRQKAMEVLLSKG